MIIQTHRALPPRRDWDHYPTPRAHVETGLSLVADDLPELAFPDAGPWACAPRRILDLGAGEGVWGTVARARWPRAEIMGLEVRPLPQPAAYDGWWTHDLATDPLPAGEPFDLVIGNPPYRHAEAFVRAGIGALAFGGRLLFLMRLAFLEGQRRRDGLFCEFPPKRVAVSSRRPSFDGSGKTNATAYAFLLFQRGYHGPTDLVWR